MRIAESARRHGVDDDAMRHAYRNVISAPFATDDPHITIFVGPDRTGALLEIGVLDTPDGPLIVHAMPARAKFLR